MEKQKIIIVDIDGTIAKLDARLGFIQRTPKEWDKFYEELDKDEPMSENILNIIADLVVTNSTPVFVTGRPERTRTDTERWITKHFVAHHNDARPENLISFPGSELFMRPENDYREDFVIKKEIHDNHILPNYEILRIYEDRQQVIRMYRDLGYEVIDMGPGTEY